MSFHVLGVTGIGEVRPGDDLTALITEHADIADGDIVTVTSKIVSKAEGRIFDGSREEAISAETASVVATRGPTRIVRTRHGLVLAAAGADVSNTAPGTVLLLPLDPDSSARTLRAELRERTGRNVAVIITDSLGRAWRNGQVDIAIGAAGVPPLLDLRGSRDRHGNVLEVTEPAIADEIAAAAELAKNKADGIPVALLRGLADRVLPAGLHGPGAAALIRSAETDLFRLGVREAVWDAAERKPDQRSGNRSAGRFVRQPSTDDRDDGLPNPGKPAEPDAAWWERLRSAAGALPASDLGASGRVRISGGPPGPVKITGSPPIDVGRVVERLLMLLHAEGLAAEVERSDAAATVRLVGSGRLPGSIH